MKRGRPKVSEREVLGSEEILTLSEVAEYLKCHPSTVYRLLKASALPSFRLGGDYRFLRSELDRWMERQAMPQRTVQRARGGR